MSLDDLFILLALLSIQLGALALGAASAEWVQRRICRRLWMQTKN